MRRQPARGFCERVGGGSVGWSARSGSSWHRDDDVWNSKHMNVLRRDANAVGQGLAPRPPAGRGQRSSAARCWCQCRPTARPASRIGPGVERLADDGEQVECRAVGGMDVKSIVVVWFFLFAYSFPISAHARQWVVLDSKTDICTATPIDGNSATQSPLTFRSVAIAQGWQVSVREIRFDDDPIPGGLSEVTLTAQKRGDQNVVMTFWTSPYECNERELFAKHPVPDEDLR